MRAFKDSLSRSLTCQMQAEAEIKNCLKSYKLKLRNICFVTKESFKCHKQDWVSAISLVKHLLDFKK